MYKRQEYKRYQEGLPNPFARNKTAFLSPEYRKCRVFTPNWCKTQARYQLLHWITQALVTVEAAKITVRAKPGRHADWPDSGPGVVSTDSPTTEDLITAETGEPLKEKHTDFKDPYDY